MEYLPAKTLTNNDERRGEEKVLESMRKLQAAIIWCGAILSERGIRFNRGEGPASSNWTLGLLSSLQRCGESVHAFAPVWERSFPRGPLFPGKAEDLEPTIQQTIVPYFNFGRCRSWTIAWMLRTKIEDWIRQNGAPKVILNYNPFEHYTTAISNVVRSCPEICWISVVLDLDDPTKDDWFDYLRRTRMARGHVFLSWWGYQNAPVEHKLHLEGGWDGAVLYPQNEVSDTFVYMGTISKLTGIDQLAKAIKLCRRKDIRFEFYGRGEEPELKSLAEMDSRVAIKGFVSKEELHRACIRARGFLNPRDVSFHGTRMIFPSKLLEYLRYRKPIISAPLAGISPEYKSALVLVEVESPAAWAATIENTFDMDIDARQIIAQRMDELLKTKTWDNQAGRLLDFIQKTYSSILVPAAFEATPRQA